MRQPSNFAEIFKLDGRVRHRVAVAEPDGSTVSQPALTEILSKEFPGTQIREIDAAVASAIEQEAVLEGDYGPRFHFRDDTICNPDRYRATAARYARLAEAVETDALRQSYRELEELWLEVAGWTKRLASLGAARQPPFSRGDAGVVRARLIGAVVH